MKISRLAFAIFALGAVLGVGGLASAPDTHAAPGPFPQWCPGEFWDPGWGFNWDGGHCHDWHRGPDFGRPGWDHGPGWDHRGPGWDHRR